MKSSKAVLLDIEIDKLTNSIEDVTTGEIVQTAVLPATAADLKTTIKKNGWRFDWRAEARQPGRTVYKLVTLRNPVVIQGLISLENKPDHLYMHLIENAPANFGKSKAYAGGAGNMVAFACKLAFEYGHQGTVSFVSKTVLIGHYATTLGAIHFGGHLMVITTSVALRLTARYFKNFRP